MRFLGCRSSHLTKSKCFPDFQAHAAGVWCTQDGRFCFKRAIPTSRVTAIPKEKIDVPKKIRKIRSGREVGDGSLVRAPVEKRKAAVV